MSFEQKPAQSSDYEMKTYKGQMAGYDEQMFRASVQNQNAEKVENFKTRLEEFQKAATLNDAKKIANTIMPVKKGRTVFYVGNAKCIVINKENILKITLKSKKEFINYCFV